mgnify:CR=1 FL=1
MTAISKVLTGMIEGRMVGYHLAAILAGYLLDLCLGDPHSMPHPVRAIGNLIVWLEKYLRPAGKKHATERGERRAGVLFVCLVLLVTGSVAGAILWISRLGGIWIQTVVEAVMTYYLLAARSLRDESMAVCRKLEAGEIEGARYAVSMIVGRDTKPLSEAGIARAAVETVAENTSDGVIAPMLYTAIGGPVIGFVYKAVNTMDSMLGYKNDKYMYFGRFAARLDDVVNFIPARISAYLMIAAAFIGGRQFDGKNAYRIFKRDRFNHASPNSAQTESVCAGALRVQLAGDAVYFGKLVKKKYIGDGLREIEYEDIKRANRLMYITAFLCELLSVAVMSLVLILL